MIKHDDLFKDTTMTFGEHLDELRVSLFKAVVGLAIGVAIGLYFGEYVVHFIQGPLEKALATYYADAGVERYKVWAAEREADGKTVPYTQQEIETLIQTHGMLYELESIDPYQIATEVQQRFPQWGAAAETSTVSVANTPTAGTSPATSLGATVPAGGAATAAGETKTTGDAAAPTRPPIAERITPIFVFHKANEDPRIRAKAMSITESFSIWLKASLVLGVVISSPWVFFQIWSFVAAGLYPHEKKYVYMFMPFSLGLFLAGAATAYWFVFAPVLGFLLGYNASLHIDPEPRIGEWLGFVLLLPLGFGVSFQLPLVMLFLERIGVFSVRAYLDKWRIAVLVIFVLSAVLTPADPYSILFMACPLTLLYFGGLLLCRYLPRSKGRGPLDEAPGR